jgi:hypothetical protein
MPSVRIDTTRLERLVPALQDLAQSQRERVIPNALNDVMDGAYTKIVRNIADVTSAQQKRVRQAIAKRPAYPGRLEARIVARDERLSIKDFRPRQTNKGVSAKVFGRQRVYRGTFIGPHGHVFRRLGKSRLPIGKLTGPAIPLEMLRNAEKIVTEVANDRFVRRLEYATDRELGRVKARYKV